MATQTQVLSPGSKKSSSQGFTFKDAFAALCAATATFLLGLNLYGEINTMRVVDNVPVEDFLYENDITLSIDETLEQIKRLPAESELEFAIRLNGVVQNSLGHLSTWRDADPDTYPQRVPLRENIWLHLISHISSDPEIVKYHFGNYRRTLERGIAICGDHSYMVSQILWDNGIDNSIIVYKPHGEHAHAGGHVIVEVRPDGEEAYMLDPDFGVVFPKVDASPEDKYTLMYNAFIDGGYSERRADMLADIMNGPFVVWKNTFSIMTNRYIFEKLAYLAKWLLPAFLMLIFLTSGLRKRLISF